MSASSAPTSPNKNKNKLLLKKRKQTDDDIENILANFSDDIMKMLTSWKEDLDMKINNIHQDINTVIKDDLNKIRTEILRIDSDMTEVKTSLEFHGNEQQSLVQSVNAAKEHLKTQSEESSLLRSEITSLQRDLNSLQQRDRLKNLEIAGIPERSNENLQNTIINIAMQAGVVLQVHDIEYVTRIQPRAKVSGRPKMIIVKLQSRILRDSIISGIRKKKGITTKDLQMAGETKPIYVNEHLTVPNKILFKNTREQAKIAKYQYVWVRDGKIFTRKDESSPAIIVRELSDLNKIK